MSVGSLVFTQSLSTKEQRRAASFCQTSIIGVATDGTSGRVPGRFGQYCLLARSSAPMGNLAS
jgi:hypothetical protein